MPEVKEEDLRECCNCAHFKRKSAQWVKSVLKWEGEEGCRVDGPLDDNVCDKWEADSEHICPKCGRDISPELDGPKNEWVIYSNKHAISTMDYSGYEWTTHCTCPACGTEWDFDDSSV
jgi:hypothetical protein